MSGTGGYDTNQVSVGATATLIAARRPGRNAVTVINNGGSAKVYLGNSAAVTTSTGAPLAAADGASVTIPTQEAVYGIVGSGSQAVGVIESY
jgi:hypothetical protein